MSLEEELLIYASVWLIEEEAWSHRSVNLTKKYWILELDFHPFYDQNSHIFQEDCQQCESENCVFSIFFLNLNSTVFHAASYSAKTEEECSELRMYVDELILVLY